MPASFALDAIEDNRHGRSGSGSEDFAPTRSCHLGRSITESSRGVVAEMFGSVAVPLSTTTICRNRPVSVRRRMRAVTGSSAVDCFCRTRCGVASMVFAALSALIFSASSEALGPSSFSGC